LRARTAVYGNASLLGKQAIAVGVSIAYSFIGYVYYPEGA
jgi:hypothetical protein